MDLCEKEGTPSPGDPTAQVTRGALRINRRSSTCLLRKLLQACRVSGLTDTELRKSRHSGQTQLHKLLCEVCPNQVRKRQKSQKHEKKHQVAPGGEQAQASLGVRPARLASRSKGFSIQPALQACLGSPVHPGQSSAGRDPRERDSVF